MLVVFAGGGTGGHLYPGVAVAQALKGIGPLIDVEFWGSGRALEKEILEKERLPCRALPCAPLPKSPFEAPRFLWSTAAGYFKARSLLKSSGAAAVVGLGGFSSYAPVKAAFALCLPVFLLEQNVVPGVANLRLARRAALVCASFEASAGRFPRQARCEVTGNPLRRAILNAAASAPYNAGGGILVLGGSTGAVGLNSLVAQAASAVAALGRSITHQTGSTDLDRVKEAYRKAGVEARVFPYVDDMPAAYMSAALVIARAGGTTLSELAVFGLPSILVPYPHHKDYHQMANARVFADAGAAEIMEERAGSGAALAGTVARVVCDARRLAAMSAAAKSLARPGAADAIASRVVRCAGESAARKAAR